MAEFLVPPKGSCIIKCKRCKGLYVPETIETSYGNAKYEPCPFCGCEINTYKNTIPVWMYNLIKLFRSGKHVDDVEGGVTRFKTSQINKHVENSESSNSEILKLQKMISELELKLKEERKPKKKETLKPRKITTFPPNKTYEIRINVNGNSWLYRVCDIVDSMADLPDTGLCHANYTYYVTAKEKFVVPDGRFWSLDNPMNQYLKGGSKSAALKEIETFCKNRSKKEIWRLTLTV